jgi:hypothetical protein
MGPATEPTTQQLADLSSLADGTLDPTRREEVEAWIAGAPERRALYERERRAVEILHRARASDRAPAGLRARVEAQRPSATVRARRRVSWGAAFAAAAAAVALAVVLILPSGTPGAPSVSQAAALALNGASGPAPLPDPKAPAARLNKDVQEVYFPNWTANFGYRAVGQRVDHVGGRIAITVYYEWHGKRVAYTIVSAPALKVPAARVTYVNGTEFRTLKLAGRWVVTWERKDHTCVLSGTGIPPAVMRQLAAWNAPGADG